MARKKQEVRKNIDESSVIIKPLGRLGGLDNIHLALGVLVIILIGLLLVLSYSKPVVTPINYTINCTYGLQNSTCVQPIHNKTQVTLLVEKLLAAYSTNQSLALLPYISNVSSMNISYLQNYWNVRIPAKNPATGTPFYLYVVVSDKNTKNLTTYIQTITPQNISNNYVITNGVIKIANGVPCLNTTPLQIYWFMDPYSSGAISSLNTWFALQKKYSNKISIQMEILFSQPSQNIANTYGVNNTTALGSYILCASEQRQFSDFTSLLSGTYGPSYVPPSVLKSIAANSNMNLTSLNTCLSSSPALINRQALLAKYYNITASPAIVTNCQYLSIPKTEMNAICYANNSMC